MQNNINIRCLRQRMGWSISDLARRLETDHISVANWERGNQEPAPQFAQKLEFLNNQADVCAQEIAFASMADAELAKAPREQFASALLLQKLAA